MSVCPKPLIKHHSSNYRYIMKKQYYIIALICLLFCGSSAFAQMVGDCVFLQAAHVEVGISPLGSFGSSRAAPASYHPDGAFSLWDPGAGAMYSTRLLGFVADPAGDGWTTGTPAAFGDYFLPGTPQEGWSIQVNGVESDAWTQALTFGPTTGFSGTLSGTNISYTTSGGVSLGVWQGQTTDPLLITQTTRLDTTKYYFTVHVVIKNTGTTTANNVYYQRTLDPDNAEEQYGAGDFTTINNIVYQLPNPGNKVMVSATSPTNSVAYLGLGTKDCRAKCYMIDFGLTPSYTLDQLYSESTTYYYTLGSTYTEDAGIGLVYNLGNILPGDSTDLTYAYVLRAADLDSALDVTSPTAVANSTLLLPGADTINVCALATDTIPVTINNGSSYTWVWAPATGLTATTGTFSDVLTDSLSAITTYTVIGTPISAGLCANDTFYFTVIPGTSAGPVVSPVGYCQYAVPDSLTAIGSNLMWYTSATGGVGSSSAPTPSTAVVGTFTWWVTQHIGSCGESVRVPITVTILPQPTIAASSNSPVCQFHTLNLISTDTITTPSTYSWSGPGGFTSHSQDTSITGVPLTASGTYTVTVNDNGCIVSAVTTVTVLPSPIITSITETNPSGCLVPDGTITLYGLNPDSTYTVTYYGPTGVVTTVLTADASGDITIFGLLAFSYTGIAVLAGDGCWSNVMSIVVTDPGAPPAPTISSNGPVCSDSTLYLYASDTMAGITYEWTFPDGSHHTIQNPVITSVTTAYSGIYTVYYITPTGCHSLPATLNVIVNQTPATPIIPTDSACAGSTLTLSVTNSIPGETYTWTGPDAYTGPGTTISIYPADTFSTGLYTVVGTVNGCPSSPGLGLGIVHPIPPAPLAPDVVYCQYATAVPLTAAGTDLWYTTAAGGTGSSTAPTPSTTTPGNVDYYVSQVVLGCESGRATVEVTTNVKPTVSIIPTSGFACQDDSVSMHFAGLTIPGATYMWTTPAGASIVVGNDSIPGPITVKFDSAGSNEVTLTVTANGCSTTNYYTVHVVATPVTGLYINPNVCVGDTVTIALTTVSPLIDSFMWNTDSTHLHIITASSNSGGPFTVTWDTAGIYIVTVTAYSSQEICPSRPESDTVDVHAAPDATFTGTGISCTGDSVLFTANTSSEADSYLWGPSGFFSGTINTPSIYGVVYSAGYITLKVTDPYGCSATDSVMYDPGACCAITFPNAFTPNHSGLNDHFRPITMGHHTLEDFRIVDRWGTTVYESTTTDAVGWDGTYGGVPQDMGVYYWYIKYTCNGNTVEETGNVTLIR